MFKLGPNSLVSGHFDTPMTIFGPSQLEGMLKET